MMSNVEFVIARDFSPHPGPRKIRQGSHSGESLRRRLLKILNDTSGSITVVLDGTKGIGSSFLDEAFGGLVRYEKKAKDELLRRFIFKSRVDPSYIDDIVASIKEAEPERLPAH